MGLCDLCQTVEFDDLPSLPAHYQETTRPWDSLMVFLSLRLINARRAGESDKVEEFSQPLGRPHHQSIEELKSAAECCSICSLIAQAVSQSLAALEEGKMDARYVYHKRHERAPDFRLWLAKRRDDCDGFMVVSSSDRYPSDVYLLAAVGFCVRDEDEPLSSCIRGRVIQDDPTSEQTLRRALNWVDECNTAHAHTRCSIGDAALPLRVLDVDYGSAPSRIRLYEPNGARGKYIALSHVWGDIRQFTTTRSNIATHLQGISFEALPKTFQDAVFLTRRLSIQYLWIDSLCICQDDGPDWERESAKMAQIYQNAYLTIAATGSKHDSHGLLANRSPPEYVDFSMTMKNGRHGEVHAFLLPLEDAAHASSYCSLREDPLSSRGWALQERFLASRILHFATKQMFFECYCHMLSEDGFRVQGRFNSIHEDVHPSQVKQEGSSLSTLKARQYRGPWLWYSLLYSYYPRNLSKSSDKLPALSGIARTFEEKTGDKYVAGLWRSQLIEGLIWQATGIQSGKMKAPPEYRAPSWSWASIDGPFGNLGLAKKDDGTDWIDIAIIIDCHVEPKGENPYGEVKSGWIQMKAPIEPLSRSEEKESDWKTAPYTRALRMKTRNGKPYGSYCMFDTIDYESALRLSLFSLILTRDDKPGDCTYQALIVTPVEGQQDHYRRVGKILIDDESLGKYDWMDDETEFRTITLV